MLEIPIPDNYKPREPSKNNSYQGPECNAKKVSEELQQKYIEPVYPVCPELKRIISKEKRYSLPDIPKINLPLLDSIIKILVVFKGLIELKLNLETVVKWAHSENLLAERLDLIRSDLSELPQWLEKDFLETSKECKELTDELKLAEFRYSLHGSSLVYILTSKLEVERQYFLDGKSLPRDFVFDNWATFLQWRAQEINQAGLSDKPEMCRLTRHYPAEAIKVMLTFRNTLFPLVSILQQRAVANNQIADTVLEKVKSCLKPLLEKASSEAEETEEPQPENYIKKGKVWIIHYAGQDVLIPSLAGLPLLEYLLLNPYKSFSAFELEQKSTIKPGGKSLNEITDVWDSETESPELTITETGGTINYKELAKADAKQLKNTINDLKTKIKFEQNQTSKDTMEEQLKILQEYRKKKTNKFGQPRPEAGDINEKTRLRVWGNLKKVIDFIEDEHKQLSAHLDNCLKTGNEFSYTPENPPNWQIF